MTDGTATRTLCGHTTDNGAGIVFRCTRPPHPDCPDQHFMARDPSSSAASREFHVLLDDHERRELRLFLARPEGSFRAHSSLTAEALEDGGVKLRFLVSGGSRG